MTTPNSSTTTPAQQVPLSVPDISVFARRMREQLVAKGISEPPSHVVLLNILAKAAGHRNYQALRASNANGGVAAPLPISVPNTAQLPKAVARALALFNTAGQLTRWPTQFAVQRIALWGVWCRLPASRELNEREVNEYLKRFNTIGDPVTLRRELVNMKLLWRTKDGSRYRRESAVPPEDTQVFLRELLRATRP